VSTRARKSCGREGCPELTVEGGAYCRDHQPITEWGWGTSRRTKDPHWDRTRRGVLSRARYMCVVCGRRANYVDHLLPQAWGGTAARENLRAMCGRCHHAKTLDEGRIGRQMKTVDPNTRAEMIFAFIANWR
jgi:5-methylcytosine-specific restriction endonuclease McrA